MLKTTLKISAWLSLLAVALATLGPMTLRPETVAGPTFERLAAFAVVGFLFAAAYPRQFWLVMVMVVTVAIALESLQTIIPGRHGEASDLIIKISGGLIGAVLAGTFTRLRRPYQPTSKPPYRSF